MKKKVNRVDDNCYNFLHNGQIHLGIFLNETLEHKLSDDAIIPIFSLRIQVAI